MRDTITILNKVLIKEFYRHNAAFFLLIGALAFGFMSGREHQALAGFFIASPVLILIPILIWIIYLWKIIRFNMITLRRAETQFLYHLTLLSRFQKNITLAWVLTGQLLPAIFYGVFLFVTAITYHQILTGFIIVIALLLINLAGTQILNSFILHYHIDKKTSRLKRYLDSKFTKPLLLIYTEWLFRREPFMVIGTKIFTCALLFAVTQLYYNALYDWRLMAMGITLAFTSNLIIIQQLHQFENFHFLTLRNLPLSHIKRLFIITLVLLVLTIPELSVIVKNFPLNLNYADIISLILFGVSIQFILYTLLYAVRNTSDRFTRIIFVMLTGWLFLILFSVPLLVLLLINFIIGSFMFFNFYYRYEYQS